MYMMNMHPLVVNRLLLLKLEEFHSFYKFNLRNIEISIEKIFHLQKSSFRSFIDLIFVKTIQWEFKQSQIILQMQVASEAFQKGNVKEAIDIYSYIINKNEDYSSQALLNRSSAYFSQGDYVLSLNDARAYILRSTKPNVQGYIMFAGGLIKTKAILSEEDRSILQRGKDEFPYHKKYLDTIKIVYELQITENQEVYMDKIFEKLLSIPTIRAYMSEESFLTKVEKMITNPSLSSALIKMDGRLAEVQQIILSADQ